MTVLSVRALNRALLARQHLLARAPAATPTMTRHLVALQAQNPGDPYLALWSRIEGFRPESLSEAIANRGAVRLGLLRTTLHLATAEDATTLWPLLAPVLARAWRSSPFRKDLAGVDIDTILGVARPFLAEPRSVPELGAHLASGWPGVPPASLAYAARFLLPIVQVPPRGLWGQTGRPRWQDLETWVRAPDRAIPGDLDGLVLRYLAAFGPATAADVARWSWLTGIGGILERLRPRLRTFRDEAGRELFDIPDAPLPDPDTPAPVRFLPEFDNVALSHADRGRIIAPAAVGRLTGWVGAFTVDGFVSGQWRLDVAGPSATLVLDPFVPLADAQRDDLVSEGEALVAFLAPDASVTELAFGVARAPAAQASRSS